MESNLLQFGKCILEQKEIVNNILPSFDLPLEHPPNCKLKGTLQVAKKVHYASVGVISDSNSNLLLTRRNKNLPTFPCNWVFPGGKVDAGEIFQDALLREIDEETGIKITKEDQSFIYKGKQCDIKPILIYESIYPKNSDNLKSHFLILYYIVILPYEYKDIEVKFAIKEVDGYTWINKEDIYGIIFEGKKMSVDGYLYNFDAKQFDQKTLSEYNFTYTEGKQEYIPHGHVSAVKILNQK